MGRVGFLYLFLISEEKLNISPPSMMLAVALSSMAFITLRYIPCQQSAEGVLLRVFVIKGCLILSDVVYLKKKKLGLLRQTLHEIKFTNF